MASSAAVARRSRALERERANTIGHAPRKKGSKALKRADHGLDNPEEEAARSLAALLNARQNGSTAIVSMNPQTPRRLKTPQKRGEEAGEGSDGIRSHPPEKKTSALERFLTELREVDGGDDGTLPPWFASRWSAAIATARSVEAALGRSLGHRPTLNELRLDGNGSEALAGIERLRDLRSLILKGEGGGGTAGDVYEEVLMQAGRRAGSADAADNDGGVGLFRGYSRELLRIRQQLVRPGSAAKALAEQALDSGVGAGLDRAQMMLTALAQRARADVAVLKPPTLLPGVTSYSAEMGLEQAQYIWLCERPERMDALRSELHAVEEVANGESAEAEAEAAEMGDDDPMALSLAQRRVKLGSRLRADAIARLVADEKRERLCEKDEWKMLLDEWQASKAEYPNPRLSAAGLHLRGASPPPPLQLHPISPPTHSHNHSPQPKPTDRNGSFRGGSFRGGSSRGGSFRSGHQSARNTSRLRAVTDIRWVDDLAREYGLEFEARQRATGVAREMAAAGYTSVQARTVLMGLLHGTQAKLRDAWIVFVPGGQSAVLTRVRWQPPHLETCPSQLLSFPPLTCSSSPLSPALLPPSQLLPFPPSQLLSCRTSSTRL